MKYIVRIFTAFIIYPLIILFMWVGVILYNISVFLYYLNLDKFYFPLKKSDYYFYLIRQRYDFNMSVDLKIESYYYDVYYANLIDLLKDKRTRVEY